MEILILNRKADVENTKEKGRVIIRKILATLKVTDEQYILTTKQRKQYSDVHNYIENEK